MGIEAGHGIAQRRLRRELDEHHRYQLLLASERFHPFVGIELLHQGLKSAAWGLLNELIEDR
jgi:hypothetical protein